MEELKMKKLVSMILALCLVFALAATATAAVSSKTTTDNTRVETLVSETGAVIEESVSIAVVEDAAPVIVELSNLFTFVAAENHAPIAYFPAEVQKDVKELLPEVENLSSLQCNEFVSINTSGYKAEYGNMTAKFEFVTKYAPKQKVVALVGVYTGEKDANGQYIVTWLPLEAVAQEDGTLAITFTEEALLMFENAYSVALTVLSE